MSRQDDDTLHHQTGTILRDMVLSERGKITEKESIEALEELQKRSYTL
jgi:hypothetical protein